MRPPQPSPVATSSIALLVAALAAVLAPPAAQAQQFGQWWWTASAGVTGNRVTARSRAGPGSTFGSDRLNLGFGLRGYIVHPAIGEFSLDLDADAAEVTGRRSVDSDHLGFNTRIKLLPYSYVPVSLFVSRSTFGYDEPAEDSSFTLRSVPESSLVWGGLVTSQWKALRGLRFRFLDREVDFLDPDLGQEVRSEQEIVWTRQLSGIHHTAKMSRRYLEFALGDFAAEDLIVALQSRGKLAPRWTWHQTVSGTRRDTNASSVTTQNFGLFSQFSSDRESGDQMRFVVGANLAEAPNQEVRSISVAAEYFWDRGGSWTLGTFVDYALVELDTATISSPLIGFSAAWDRQLPSWSLSLVNKIGYRVSEADGTGTAARDSTALSLDSRLSLAAGARARLKHRYELAVTRNELRFLESADPDRIDFGLIVNPDLLVDSVTGRVRLDRTWNRLRASSNTIWTRRESAQAFRASAAPAPAPETRGFTSEALSQVFQLSRQPFDLTVSLGTSRVATQASPRQRSDLLTATLGWRPKRFLRLHARYRSEEREVILGPRLDFERLEAGVDFAMGLLSFEVDYFETRDNAFLRGGKSSSGIRWRITRRALGLLPIISAPKRGGFIR